MENVPGSFDNRVGEILADAGELLARLKKELHQDLITIPAGTVKIGSDKNADESPPMPYPYVNSR